MRYHQQRYFRSLYPRLIFGITFSLWLSPMKFLVSQWPIHQSNRKVYRNHTSAAKSNVGPVPMLFPYLLLLKLIKKFSVTVLFCLAIFSSVSPNIEKQFGYHHSNFFQKEFSSRKSSHNLIDILKQFEFATIFKFTWILIPNNVCLKLNLIDVISFLKCTWSASDKSLHQDLVEAKSSPFPPLYKIVK